MLLISLRKYINFHGDDEAEFYLTELVNKFELVLLITKMQERDPQDIFLQL